MNHCSHWTRFYGHPAYRDFDLVRRGAAVRLPRGQRGHDVRRRLVVHRLLGLARGRSGDGRTERWQDGIERTHEQIRRVLAPRRRHVPAAARRSSSSTGSPRSGATASARRCRGASPTRWRSCSTIPDSGIEPVHQFMSVRQLAYDFFESDELRTLFMRAATTSTGCFPDDVPGLQGLVHNLPLVLSFEPAAIAVGGSQAISDALVVGGPQAAAPSTSPTQEVVGDPRRRASARPGSSLADGTSGRRRRRGQRAGRAADRAAAARPATRSTSGCATGSTTSTTTAASCFWANLALHEPPATAHAASNPGVGPQPRLYWGPKDPDYIALALPGRGVPRRASPSGRSC